MKWSFVEETLEIKKKKKEKSDPNKATWEIFPKFPSLFLLINYSEPENRSLSNKFFFSLRENNENT